MTIQQQTALRIIEVMLAEGPMSKADLATALDVSPDLVDRAIRLGRRRGYEKSPLFIVVYRESGKGWLQEAFHLADNRYAKSFLNEPDW